jgi:methylenetetrahydrofolate dehydrogenase (NADP+)/methenyltetrahydrofolate cyclohydrolase
MKILDWKTLSEKIKFNLKQEVLEKKLNPYLAVILIWENPASKVYVKFKEKACENIWIKHERFEFNEKVLENEILEKIRNLNSDKKITGIMVQLPIPKHISVPKVIKEISPKKDVDWFTAYNNWKMLASKEFENLPSATPAWIISLLEEYKIELEWKNAVIIWRSNIVWKPIWLMFLNRWATVTFCHSKTKDLEFYTKNADILVVAIWKDRFLKKEMVKKWAIIIDVWINRANNWKLYWDCDFEDLKEKVWFITPVPWWVWPMTVVSLMKNIVKSSI